MNYFEELKEVISNIEVSDKNGKTLNLETAISEVVDIVIKMDRKDNKVILLGNGGSASIASHIVTDFLKNGNIPAITFSDSSLLTCLSNDLGYENVFAKPLEILAKLHDILFIISSSGKSKNILNAARKAKEKGCFLVTLSGFEKENLLRKMGDINFYVPSDAYGFVEIAHLAVCHSIVDNLLEENG